MRGNAHKYQVVDHDVAIELFHELQRDDETLSIKDLRTALMRLEFDDTDISRLIESVMEDGHPSLSLDEFVKLLEATATIGMADEIEECVGVEPGDENDIGIGVLVEGVEVPEEDGVWAADEEEEEIEVHYEDEDEWSGVEDDMVFDDSEVEKLEHFSFPPEADPHIDVPSDQTKRLWFQQTGKALHFLTASLTKIFARLQGGELNLSAMQMDDPQVSMLADLFSHDAHEDRLEKVTELILARNFMTSIGGCRIIEAVIPNPTIVRIDLSGNMLGDKRSHLSGEGCGPVLGRLLKTNTTLRDLVLDKNRLGDLDVKYIAEALCENCSLLSLSLADNELTWVSGDHIRIMLSTNGDLRELNLAWNQLSSKGTLLVLEGLRSNNVLKRVNLSWTGITDKGGVAVGEVIKGNSSLEEMDISHNRIGRDGSTKIAEGLSQNGSLKKLLLSSNPLAEAGVTAIVRALRINATCDVVDMQGCQSGETASEEVTETLKGRKNQLSILYSFSTLPHPGMTESELQQQQQQRTQPTPQPAASAGSAAFLSPPGLGPASSAGGPTSPSVGSPLSNDGSRSGFESR